MYSFGAIFAHKDLTDHITAEAAQAHYAPVKSDQDDFLEFMRPYLDPADWQAPSDQDSDIQRSEKLALRDSARAQLFSHLANASKLNFNKKDFSENDMWMNAQNQFVKGLLDGVVNAHRTGNYSSITVDFRVDPTGGSSEGEMMSWRLDVGSVISLTGYDTVGSVLQKLEKYYIDISDATEIRLNSLVSQMNLTRSQKSYESMMKEAEEEEQKEKLEEEMQEAKAIAKMVQQARELERQAKIAAQRKAQENKSRQQEG